jgi:V8-like Glu-specific endopeptidase
VEEVNNRLGIPRYVVRISGESYAGQVFNGTGFLISPKGHVATCRHVVVHDGQNARKIKIYIYGYDAPWEYQIRDSSQDDDVALLESIVPPTNETTYATLHTDWHQDVQIGQRLTIYGHSSADNYPTGQQYPCTISGFSEKDGRVGVISEINPGDSGGPVIDDNERVVGIINAKDRVRDGQARFVPISLLINLLNKSKVTFQKTPQFNLDYKFKQPYAPNPFTSRKGITKSDAFFNREEEQQTIRDYLHNRQNCQIVGPRRIGKTSLLFQIERFITEWEETAVIAYLDQHDAHCHQLSSWLKLASHKFGWVPSATNLAEFTEHVENMISRNLLPVLCLDEFDDFTRRRDEFDRDFFTNLRHCGNEGMAIITASQKQLNELTDPDDPTSPFYNTFPLLELGPFTEEDVQDFLTILRPGIPPFQSGEKDMILNFAKGHPLALQVACFHVVKARISGIAVATALQKAAKELKAYLPSDWKASIL